MVFMMVKTLGANLLFSSHKLLTINTLILQFKSNIQLYCPILVSSSEIKRTLLRKIQFLMKCC